MKLYLISQDSNSDWDTYDSAVVAAESEEAARATYPGYGDWDERSWASSPAGVTAVYLGEAEPTRAAGVICASFNAG